MERVITSIAFDTEGVTLTYLTLPGDLRENGLAQQHQLSVPRGEDYGDEIDAVMDATRALLEDALEDFARVPAYVPGAPETDDDDDEGDE